MSKKLTSILTDDMEHCYFTGKTPVERHHIFGSFNRKRSEEYGYIAPLSPELHPNGVMAGDNWKEIDLYLKQECQKDYEKTKSRDEWIKEFGQSWL